MTTQHTNTQTKHKKSANPSITLRLSRGRTLKITFRPRIRVSPLLIKLLAVASGIFAFGAGLAHAAPPAVNALPTGGQVVSGVSTIQQVGSALNINQATQKTIINWQSFDIGSQAAVNFYQPNASSIALNRIVGNNASQIYGKLNANGQVFLLNPHGTLFAPGAQVNVGKALLSSTMHMNDADFLAGNYNLSNPGLGIIDNQSIINANSIAFAGNDINNSGSLIATNVSLVAGDTVAVDISGDGLIRARVENPSLQAHITNSGLIDAVHQVTMSAGQAKDTLNNVVNNSGIIKATGLSNEGGVITLQGGTTLNSGSLNASSATGKGGTVAMLGEHVGVTGFGGINASGETGGGTILVGGDYQGKNANVQNASRTYFGADASLKADAITSGDGGKVIVWADEVTRSYGNISARGGNVSGNGGFVEVSGKQSLDYAANTDTRAANGLTGTLLLDPDSITISSIGANTASTNLSFAAAPSISIISPTTLNTASSNIILQANDDISFDEAVTIAAAGVGVTAQAGGFLYLQAPLTTTGGVVNLVAGDPGSLTSPTEGSLVINANIDTTRGGIAPNGANVLLESNISDVGGNSVQLSANVNAGNLGNIIITDNGGATDQFGGILTGNKLTVLATHNVNLTGANQLNIAQIETSNSLPTTISNINLTNTRPLTIDGMLVDAGGGSGGSVTVNNTGSISLNGSVTVANGNINFSTTGALTSTSNLNVIDRSSSVAAGNIIINAGANIGTSANNIYIAPGSGNVSLTAGSGAGSNIYTNQVLSALDTSKYIVNAALANATVSLSSSGAININNLSPTNFQTTNDNLKFSTNGGDISIANGVTATANTFSFETFGVGNDVFVGSGAGTVSLNANNPTGVDFNAHTVVFNNNLTDSISTINDNIHVKARAGGVSGAGGITTSNLWIESDGAVNLTGSNLVSKIAADVINSGAAFNFNNAGALEVSSLFGVTGITTNNGNVNLTGQDIAINNVIDTTGGNLTIHSSYNPLNINADLAANNVTLSTFDGDINLNAANITASGNVLINSGRDPLNSTVPNAGLVTIDGNITQTGASLATLDINADTNIIVAAGSQISSTNASNITLKSGSNGTFNSPTLIGRIELNGLSGGGNEVRIDSKGGNITLTGGSGFSSTTFGDGILLNYAQLDARSSSSVGGNITLKGETSYTDVSANGVTMLNSTVRTKGAGVIDIQGVATAAAGSGTRGTVITATNMDSENGDINITGDASAATFSVVNSDGVLINGGSIIVAGADNGSGFGSGNIFVTGKSALGGTDQAGIAIADSPTELDTHGTGNITLDGVSNGIGANSAGVLIFNSALIESEGSGEIAITGKANNIDAPGVAIASGATVKGAIGDYITIRAGNNSSTGGDFISFVGGSIQGTSGTIMVLTPLLSDPNASIAVGGNGSTVGNFNVSDADLSAISNIQSFQIGDTFHTGTYNVASLNSFNSTNGQINLVSNTANIDFIAPTTALNTGILVNANNGNVNFSSGLTTNAGNVFVIAKNDLTLSSTAAIANNAGNITLIADTGDFINNNSSPSALSVSAGSRWLVYSADLTGDTRGTLVYDFKQYNASYGSTVLGTGNGFLYGDVPGTLTASITGSITKDYDGSTIASVPLANLSLSGTLLDGDTVTFTGGAANYTDPNAGTGKTVNMTSITATATDGLATVYGYTLPTVASTSTAVITPKSITSVTGITAADKVYDGNTSATLSTTSAVFNGIVSGETLSVTGASGLFNSKDVATANTVNISGITLADSGTFLASNYSLASNTGSDVAVITPKAISSVTGITANNKATYDGTTTTTLNTAAAGFTGKITGDTLTVGAATGAFADKNVGTGKTVNITGIALAGTDAGNYNLTNNTATTTADITNKANIAAVTGITANNKATYDGTTTTTLNTAAAGFTGKITGDTLTVGAATGAFADKNVGTGKTVNITGIALAGTDAGNYNLTNNTATTTADITNKANIAAVTGITANNKATYDGTTTTTLNTAAAGFTGKITGDTLTVGAATGAFADKNVGTGKTVNITGIALAGTDAGNYNLTNNTATTTADITNKANIAAVTGITANNKATYDGTTTTTLNTAAAGFTGKITGDTLTVGAATGAFADKNVGTGKTVNITGIALAGTDAGNYNLTNNTATTTADITNKANIAAVTGITANNKATYDGTTTTTLNTAAAGFTGKITGDTLTVGAATGAFADKNVGTG